MIDWKAERNGSTVVARLADHYKAGLSITKIGEQLTREFGQQISRNAVIAKASREGFTALYPREACISRNGTMSSFSQAAHHMHELAESGALPPLPPSEMNGHGKTKRRKKRTNRQILEQARTAQSTARVTDTGFRDGVPAQPTAPDAVTEIQWDADIEIPHGRHHYTADMQCLWPKVKPTDAIRCEAACMPGHPYCAAHVKRAYTKFGTAGADPQAVLQQVPLRYGRNGGFR